MFGIGGRSFTHQIATRLGIDFDMAERLKLNLDRNLLSDPAITTIADAASANELEEYLADDSRRNKIEAAVDSNVETWLSGIEIALEEFDNIEMLPNKILLCGGGAGLVRLQEALATEDWWSELPFSRRPTVHLLDDIDIPGIENTTAVDLDYSYITAFGLLRVALDTMSNVEQSNGLRGKIAKILQN